jgi:endonuclease/exonuclease/phosphatase family metal-dependent hydrolase
MSTFRLATINVYSFRNPSSYHSNISDLVSILESFNLDLIALQQIQNNHKWDKFCSRLSLHHYIYRESRHFFGNGIASPYPISFHSNQKSISSQDETRSLLQCRLDGAIIHLFKIDYLL